MPVEEEHTEPQMSLIGRRLCVCVEGFGEKGGGGFQPVAVERTSSSQPQSPVILFT